MRKIFAPRFFLAALFILVTGCNQDMATYTHLSSERPCGEKKVALLSPNIYGMDEDLFEAASNWVQQSLSKQGYIFDPKKRSTVLITMRHESKATKKERVDVDQAQEPYEGEGNVLLGDLYQHHLTLWIDDNACKKESLTLEASLETYSSDLREIAPELLQALDDSLANSRGPVAKTKKRVLRVF